MSLGGKSRGTLWPQSVPRQVSRTGSIFQVPLGCDAEWPFYSEVISSPDSSIEAACHSFANAPDANANHDHYKRGGW